MRPHRKNPKIANVFSQMGIVEELGSGIRKMFKYTPLYANGKEPIIEEQDVYRIEIPYVPTLQSTETDSGQKSGPESGPGSGPESTRKRIIKLLIDNPSITSRQIAERLKMARSGISKHLHLLQESGKIKHIGPNKGGHWEVVED